MLKNIKTEAQKVLTTNNVKLSLFMAIDLALLSEKSWYFRVSKEEYVELVSAYGLILDNPNILVVPNKEFNLGVEGFLSVYDKLNEKFSYAVGNKFKKVKILIVMAAETECSFVQTVKQKTIDGQSTYSSVLSDLKDVNYEQVGYVEQPKQFCVKGGVIDIYSPMYSQPARVCLYDEQLSIFFYNLGTGLMFGEKIQELNIAKQGTKKIKVAIKSLVDLGGLSEYKGGFYKTSSTNKTFKALDYKSFVKVRDRATYISNLYFSAYNYLNCIIAPPSYQGQGAGSVQQEDVALEVGDVVCHEDFGLGVLVGLVGSESDEEEFLQIKYEDAVVRLSIGSLHKLSFVSRENTSTITLNSLSKKGVWVRQKNKIKDFAENKTRELVDFYINKKDVYRAPYVSGGELEKEFLGAFEYEDTVDQGVVWKETVGDLEKDVPMYRLLCGDVGFGKTELAIRAAFRVVVNGGRVLVLAPTSVLVRQHFEVFNERLSAFGVSVGYYVGSLLETKKVSIKSGWVGGEIDVLIGTSAVFYDVVFIRYASFFIIDEEHRFGVKDKEGIFEGSVNKDVLLMSATPIPRSLSLGLSGVNTISTLSSPPVLRRPIQTFISYFDDSLVARAIEFELARGGQVFFVHNNIESIVSIKNYLARLAPMASVVVAHSKVNRKQLEGDMLRFVEGKADILLCTSIIGSGIDIPNANTIIVNRSHRFGLGQLHQIRGRVGRSKRQGFAYMLIPKGFVLSQKAQKRLLAIEKNVSLGSGYHIAKSDLKIRGGGMMFGYQQSGKGFDFGFEFYAKSVARSLVSVGGVSSSFIVDNFVYSVDFLCCFPKKYIQNSFDRLRNYRLLNSLYSKEKIVAFKKDLVNIYGPLPDPALNVLNLRLLAVLSSCLGLVHTKVRGCSVSFSFNNTFEGGSDLFKFLGGYGLVLGVNDYSFRELEQVLELCLQVNKNTKIDGGFLVGFIKRFKDFYDKK